MELNKVLHRLEQEKQNQPRNGDFTMIWEGKKFLFLKDFSKKTEALDIGNKGWKIYADKLIDDKKTGETTSTI